MRRGDSDLHALSSRDRLYGELMRSLIALPFAALMLLSAQASALCLSVSESFGGIVEPDSEITAHGPFSITGSNGCSGANIDAMVSTGGSGRAPQISIEREVGSAWTKVAANPLSPRVSWLGSFGTYRVRVHNPEAVSKTYSGTVRYGR